MADRQALSVESANTQVKVLAYITYPESIIF